MIEDKDELIEDSKKALNMYYDWSDPNDWTTTYGCTTEGMLMFEGLASILLLKLEKDGLIIPFSHNLPGTWRGYSNIMGQAMMVDEEREIISTAIYTAFTECGWVFPPRYNLVPEDCADGWYGSCASGPYRFWETEYDDLNDDVIVKLVEMSEFMDDVPDEDIIEALREDNSETKDYEPTEIEIALRKLHDYGDVGTLLCYYNPSWCEIMDRVIFLKENNPELLSDAFNDLYEGLARDVEAFERPTAIQFTDSVMIEGHRVFLNYSWAWYFCEEGTEMFYLNPLCSISPAEVFTASSLRDRIRHIREEVDRLYTDNNIVYGNKADSEVPV